MKYILAHDIGTTGNKATLYKVDGESLGSTFCGYETQFPLAGWAEQNPYDWWRAVCSCTQELLARTRIPAAHIACITFSGQMMGCVMVDREGTILRNAIIWADMRAESEAEELLQKVGMERIYRVTGHRISSSYSGAKLKWVQNHEPELYRQTYKVLHAKDYLIYRLTGVFATDYTDASGMNLFDIVRKEWSAPILTAWALDGEKLPDAYPSTHVIGMVTAAAAEETGLRPGTPVVLGGGDGCCAAVGVGVVHEGEALNYIGSSSWVATAAREPIYDPQMKTYNWIHLDSTMYSPNGTMQAAGASYQWVRDQLYPREKEIAEQKGGSVYEVMNESAARSIPGSRGLFYLPYLMGERSPRWNPNARGVFMGLHITHSRDDLTRAVIEGVAFNLKVIYDSFVKCGVTMTDLWILGGAAKGRIWRQIIADVMGIPVRAPHLLLEATSMGAAVAGGIGVGLIKDFSTSKQWVALADVNVPSTVNHDVYLQRFELFEELYERLVPLFSRVAQLST